MDKIEALVDRIIYSDLVELGYNAALLEPERAGLLTYIKKLAKGKEGRVERGIRTKKKYPVRTASAEEIKVFERARNIDNALQLPVEQQVELIKMLQAKLAQK
tara:strand:+ start:299 stop:607 length:309 start_codon:yes stop_codon:yes gene_type:complete